MVFPLPAISELALPAFDSRFFCSGWTDLSPTTFSVAGSGDIAAAVPLHGPPRTQAEHDDRIPYRPHFAGARVHSPARSGPFAFLPDDPSPSPSPPPPPA